MSQAQASDSESSDRRLEPGDLAAYLPARDWRRILWLPEFPRAANWVGNDPVTLVDKHDVNGDAYVAVTVRCNDLPVKPETDEPGEVRRMFWDNDDVLGHPVPVSKLVRGTDELIEAIERDDYAAAQREIARQNGGEA